MSYIHVREAVTTLGEEQAICHIDLCTGRYFQSRKNTLSNTLNHIYIWPVIPHLRCKGTCEISTLYLIISHVFDNCENKKTGVIREWTKFVEVTICALSRLTSTFRVSLKWHFVKGICLTKITHPELPFHYLKFCIKLYITCTRRSKPVVSHIYASHGDYNCDQCWLHPPNWSHNVALGAIQLAGQSKYLNNHEWLWFFTRDLIWFGVIEKDVKFM